MIYLTGDTHGDFADRLNPLCTPGEETWSSKDKLIVLGDFGLIFYPRIELYADKLARERENKAFLEAKEYEILFIDGNHENFDRLTSEFPEEERYGGTVRRIGRNIFWLRRGEIYTIEGKTFFCMGSAYSIDKSDRLAHDRAVREYFADCPDLRISWWPQELPTGEEYRKAAANLIARGRRADFILSHQAPLGVIRLMGCYPDPHDMELAGFLDWVWFESDFSHWYFGHWHIDEEIHPKATALFRNVAAIAPTD